MPASPQPPMPEDSGWIAALRHFWEQRCPVCLEPWSPAAELCCPACQAKLPPRIAGYCSLCGELAAFPDAPCVPCGACLKQAPPWQHLVFYGVYEKDLRALLLRYKFGGNLYLGALLGSMLAYACASLPRPDILIPVPLHPRRLRQRGFNQCLELARVLSRYLEIPLHAHLLERSVHTRAQARLNLKERTHNVTDAFYAPVPLAGQRILLIDDIATTGSTLRAASQTLLQAGAACVDIALLARTPKQ